MTRETVLARVTGLLRDLGINARVTVVQTGPRRIAAHVHAALPEGVLAEIRGAAQAGLIRGAVEITATHAA